MKKRWYEIIGLLPFDIEPIIWFFLSTALIMLGVFFIGTDQKEAGTLFAALGGAGITRVRGGRKDK